MKYNIEVAGLCIRGPRRQRNEDNLLCGGRFFPLIHGDNVIDEERVSAKDHSWIAVFDGVGGEAKGEAASYLAARWLAENGEHITDPQEIALSMNSEVLRYAQKERIKQMGTTVCALRFGDDGISGFNAGDSRCYHLSDGRMERLSEDHAKYAGTPQHRLLTQYIGVEESEFIVTPHVFTRNYNDGDIYMLCTDGVTDLIADRRIKDVLGEESSLDQKIQAIRSRLDNRGTPDNATVILAKVVKES